MWKDQRRFEFGVWARQTFYKLAIRNGSKPARIGPMRNEIYGRAELFAGSTELAEILPRSRRRLRAGSNKLGAHRFETRNFADRRF
jgi:hypothetical protein